MPSAIASSAAGKGPNGPSFDASLTTRSSPSSRCTSSTGFPGWYGVRPRTLGRKKGSPGSPASLAPLRSERVAIGKTLLEACCGTVCPRGRLGLRGRSRRLQGMAELGLFPLPLVLVPTERIPLHIFEPRYRELIDECVATDGDFGLVLATGDGAVHEIGTRASVQQVLEVLDDGSMNVIVEGGERFRLLELTKGRAYTTGIVEPVVDLDEPADQSDLVRAAELFAQLAEVAESDVDLPDVESPQFEFELAARVDFGVDPKQELLASTSPRARIKRLNELLEIAIEAVRLEHTLRERAGLNGKVSPLETDL